MRDSLTSANRTDFSQRYKGVFGWLLKDNQERVLVHITDVQPNQVIFQTSKSAGYFAFSDQGVVFEFLPVTRGFIPTDGGVYLLQRHPARQFQRGISEHNTQIYQLTERRFEQPRMDIQLLSNVFEKPITYRENVEKYLDKSSNVCALSIHFAIKKEELYFMNRLAGKVVDRTTIEPMDLIRQELQDLINRNVWLSPFQLQQAQSGAQ